MDDQPGHQGGRADVGEGTDVTASQDVTPDSNEPDTEDETGEGAEAPDELGGTAGVEPGGAG